MPYPSVYPTPYSPPADSPMPPQPGGFDPLGGPPLPPPGVPPAVAARQRKDAKKDEKRKIGGQVLSAVAQATGQQPTPPPSQPAPPRGTPAANSTSDAAPQEAAPPPVPAFQPAQYKAPAKGLEYLALGIGLLFPGAPIARAAAGFAGGLQTGAENRYAREEGAAEQQYKAQESAYQDQQQAALQAAQIADANRLVLQQQRQDAFLGSLPPPPEKKAGEDDATFNARLAGYYDKVTADALRAKVPELIPELTAAQSKSAMAGLDVSRAYETMSRIPMNQGRATYYKNRNWTDLEVARNNNQTKLQVADKQTQERAKAAADAAAASIDRAEIGANASLDRASMQDEARVYATQLVIQGANWRTAAQSASRQVIAAEKNATDYYDAYTRATGGGVAPGSPGTPGYGAPPPWAGQAPPGYGYGQPPPMAQPYYQQAPQYGPQSYQQQGGGLTHPPPFAATPQFTGLQDLWVRAGGDPSVAPLMATVAMNESGGNPAQVNSIGASGLWQMNGHQDLLRQLGGTTWTDPMTNARGAVALYNARKAHGGSGLEDWEDSRNKGGYGGWGQYAAGAQGGGGGNMYLQHGAQTASAGGGGQAAQSGEAVTPEHVAHQVVALYDQTHKGQSFDEAWPSLKGALEQFHATPQDIAASEQALRAHADKEHKGAQAAATSNQVDSTERQMLLANPNLSPADAEKYAKDQAQGGGPVGRAVSGAVSTVQKRLAGKLSQYPSETAQGLAASGMEGPAIMRSLLKDYPRLTVQQAAQIAAQSVSKAKGGFRQQTAPLAAGATAAPAF